MKVVEFPDSLQGETLHFFGMLPFCVKAAGIVTESTAFLRISALRVLVASPQSPRRQNSRDQENVKILSFGGIVEKATKCDAFVYSPLTVRDSGGRPETRGKV